MPLDCCLDPAGDMQQEVDRKLQALNQMRVSCSLLANMLHLWLEAHKLGCAPSLQHFFFHRQANDTKKVFVKILNWSFRALAMGKFPDTDWQGKAWPAGSRGDKIKNTDLAGGS